MANAHPAVMFEFIARDQQRLCEFYQEVFGWHYDVRGGFAYLHFPEQPVALLGGIGQAQDGVPGWRPGRSFYLATADLEATLVEIAEAGGTVTMPITEVDGYRFAMFTDPEGNLVGLLEQHPSGPDIPDSPDSPDQ